MTNKNDKNGIVEALINENIKIIIKVSDRKPPSKINHVMEIGIIYDNMPAKLDLTALSKLKLLYLTSNGENQVTA